MTVNNGKQEKTNHAIHCERAIPEFETVIQDATTLQASLDASTETTDSGGETTLSSVDNPGVRRGWPAVHMELYIQW